MSTITLHDVAARLPEILASLAPGEQVVIVENGAALATMTRSAAAEQWPCQAGSAKQTDHWMAPDFDAPLAEFSEYVS